MFYKIILYFIFLSWFVYIMLLYNIHHIHNDKILQSICIINAFCLVMISVNTFEIYIIDSFEYKYLMGLLIFFSFIIGGYI